MSGDVDNIESFLDDLEVAAAEMLLLAAETLQQRATADQAGAGKNPMWAGKRKRKGEKAYQNPAPKGQFPHNRTGALRSGFIWQPQSVSEIRRTGYVRVGYESTRFYGIALGNRGWKWLEDSFKNALPTIQASVMDFEIRVT